VWGFTLWYTQGASLPLKSPSTEAQTNIVAGKMVWILKAQAGELRRGAESR